MELDDKHVEELKKVTDSYISIAELAEKLQRDYVDLSNKFEKQSFQFEEINSQLAEALSLNNQLSVHLNNILECLDAGVVVLDGEGQITTFNRAAERLTGLARDNVLMKQYDEVFFGDEHQPTLSLLDGEEIKVRGEKWFGTQPVGYSSSRISDENNIFCGVVEILYDISAEKKLRETIRHVSALAAVGEMAATVAHQVRNPLAGIIGFTDLLKRDLGDNNRGSALADKILIGAKELNRIITSLLDYTRKTSPDFHDLDLARFLNETISSLMQEDHALNVKFEMISDIQELTYRFDPVLFRQVITNLFHNACQAMEPDGGTIRLSVRRRDDDRLIIVFADSGNGFPEDDAEEMFKPFYTTRNNGVGLGLSMVRKVIDFHNGKIYASNNPEGGAVFTIELPL